jgi:hypothetical protein
MFFKDLLPYITLILFYIHSINCCFINNVTVKYSCLNVYLHKPYMFCHELTSLGVNSYNSQPETRF